MNPHDSRVGECGQSCQDRVKPLRPTWDDVRGTCRAVDSLQGGEFVEETFVQHQGDFRFGQCRNSSFIMSKVHALYFCKDPAARTWNPDEVLELSDRASVYGDPRTMAKENNKGMRVPMDVWYGKYWGRIQGNNKERRHNHQNQIPEVYLERVIRSCSNEGDLVLDPFTGSGTTCTVARALGRRSIGIEYSPTIAESAWERINTIGMIRTDGVKGGSSAIVAPRRARPASPDADAS